jgi:8-oxo-dGTP pyrophosphatase MutT (NUDIX family)
MTDHAFMEIVLQSLIVNERGEILILRRPLGQWQFVGGRVNQGEHWLEGLRREIREETAIAEFEIISVMAIDNWVWEAVPQFGIYLFCRTTNPSVVLSEEHTEYRWTSSDTDLSQFEFFHPSLLTLLKRALNGETEFQML